MTPRSELADSLRAIVRASPLPQRELARRLGLAPSGVSSGIRAGGVAHLLDLARVAGEAERREAARAVAEWLGVSL